jgi:hypothetical protein
LAPLVIKAPSTLENPGDQVSASSAAENVPMMQILFPKVVISVEVGVNAAINYGVSAFNVGL